MWQKAVYDQCLQDIYQWQLLLTILIPKAFGSFERAIAQPSLFESTTTGLLIKSSRKSLSQEA